MTINFIGNFQKGYVGEVADETHIARELEELGHTVRRIPRDEWREYCLTGKDYPNVPSKMEADFNIITKWHHFDDGRYADELRRGSGGPVFYWVWDYMFWEGIPHWHLDMVESSDLYLGNDVRSGEYPEYLQKKLYYFPFDVADGEIPRFQVSEKKYDTVFFGSHVEQGDRIAWLTQINQTNPVQIFAWNYEEWIKRGFVDAKPAVYGAEFARTVAESKVILGFSVEPNCWGYWSNRVGKILTLGGFLLYQYAPGMELFLRDGVEYFSSPEEACEKIDHYLIADTEREQVARIGWMIGQENFTSKARVKELCILAERFTETGGDNWKL